MGGHEGRYPYRRSTIVEKAPSSGKHRDRIRLARTLFRDAVRGFVRRPGRSEAGIPVGAKDRRAELARMGTRIGVRLARARVMTRRADREQRRKVFEEAALKSAQEVFDVMGNMKGASMKVAQMASYTIDGLPEGMKQQLAGLQQAAPPMSWDLAAGVIEEELGAPPEDLLAEIDPVPIAAASIGQVHQARTPQGKEVAIKVQYPGVDEAVVSDLKNADLIFGMVASLTGGYDPAPIIEEVLARMTEEFDYRKEAANQQWYADRYRGHPYVKIPEIVGELSAGRVLTSELVEGRKFYDVLDDSQEDRNRYGEIIYRFAFTSIYGDSIFSGDPHPGNYIFMDDGRICFLDFGLVKRLETEQEREFIKSPARAVVSGDRGRLVQACREVGFVPEGVEVDHNLLWEFFRVVFRPMLEDSDYSYSMGGVGDALRRIFAPDSDLSGLLRQLWLPPMFAIYNRYTFGTHAVLGHLAAAGNWHRMIREFLFDEPPSTEIGGRWQ